MTSYATALHDDLPTPTDEGTSIPAGEALLLPASRAMYAQTRQITAWLAERGGANCDVVADYDAATTRPGGLMVRWGNGPSVREVVAAFGPIPCWMDLRHDDMEWDDVEFVLAHSADRTRAAA